MSSNSPAITQVVLPASTEIPASQHRWNYWIAGGEAALFMSATDMMGPMTLIPFLFAKTGIDMAWIGLFSLVTTFTAFGSPLGSAWAAGRQWKLPFCLRVGFIQRLGFLAVPLGAMWLFDYPGLLLGLLAVAWSAVWFVGGIGAPVYQFVITHGTWESWWGRMLALRCVLAAIAGTGATLFVWWVNRAFAAPHNYEVIGWAGVAMLSLSLYLVSRFREVPIDQRFIHGPEPLRDTFRKLGRVFRDDPRLRWIVLAYTWRSGGFVVGAYMTAVLVERCHLTDRDMWIPLLISTLPAILCHLAAGWIVDRWGAKPALVISSAIITVNSTYILFCYSLPAFMVLFVAGYFAGSLVSNAWPTLMMKLAPPEQRPTYYTALTLATTPGVMLIMSLGIVTVRYTGYDYVFYIGILGGLISTYLFATKLSNIRNAPLSPAA